MSETSLNNDIPHNDIPPQLGRGDERVCIAILDGQVDVSHPCFQGANVRVVDVLLRQNGATGAALAHGTHVASIVFGQPGSAVEGIAPRCRGLFVPIFSEGGDGEQLGCSQLDLARAILIAVEHGAHIINISGGQPTRSGEPAPVLAQAIEACARRNVLIVAAAGNDGCECLHVPAAGRTVLAVGAMDRDGAPLPSSNWGGRYRAQGILAPGVDVLGAMPGGGTVRRSGTSFAAPCVSGLAGLLASLQLEQGRALDPRAIGAVLLKSASPCEPGAAEDCRRVLAGRLNIQAAIDRVTNGEETMMDEQASGDVATLSALSDASSFTEKAPTLGASRIAAGTSRIAAAAPAAHAAAESGAVRMSEDMRASAASDATVIPPIRPKAQLPMAPVTRNPGRVTLSDCGCGGGESCSCGSQQTKPALVFALGQLDYDFGTDARRDSFIQHMPSGTRHVSTENLIAYLKSNEFKFEAASLIWLLTLDETPIYAIQPAGPFAIQGYDFLIKALEGQLDPDNPVELVSLPGVIAGSVRLRSGQIVPMVVPRVLGMFAWSSKALTEHVLGPRPEGDALRASFDAQRQGIINFIERVYYELRNLGITGEDRALNFAATNLVQALEVQRRLVFKNSLTQNGGRYELDTICVEKSPICRSDSECYDVKLCFFDPENVMRADQVIKFTIDVTDSMPVSIGKVSGWSVRECRDRSQGRCY